MPNVTPNAINTDLVNAIQAEAAHLTVLPAEDDRPKAQGFPVHALPDAMQTLGKDLEQDLGLGTDYTCPVMIVAASVAIGTSARMQAFPGMEEHPSVWVVVVAPPGTGKTPAAKKVLGPLRKVDAEHYRTYQAAQLQYRKELREARKDEGATEPPSPVCAQHLVSDITMEALLNVLRVNPRGVGLVRDEFAGLVGDFGRYSNGSDEAKYLSMWSGDPVSMNRKTNNEIVAVAAPFLSMFGGIQPGVLNRIAADGRDQNGFLDRLLFVYPESYSMPSLPTGTLHASVLFRWERTIQRLLSIPTPSEGCEPLTLRFTEQAQAMFAKFYATIQAEHTKLVGKGEHRRAGYRSKMIAYVLRFALIDALVQWTESSEGTPVPELVDIDSLGAAITLVDCFATTGDKVRFTLFESTPVDGLSGEPLKLFDALPNEFRTAEAVVKAEAVGLSMRTAKRLLNKWAKDKLLNRDGQGRYSKRFEH